MKFLFVIAMSCGPICAQLAARHPKASSTTVGTLSQLREQTRTDGALPDVAALMHDVEANESKAEAVEKDYIYHSVETQQEEDSHGLVKKTTVTEYDHFWVNGVPVRRGSEERR